MDNNETKSSPQQASAPTQPPAARQPDPRIQYPFNPDIEDTPPTSEAQPAPVAPPKKKKRLLIGLILTALILLGLGLTYVYGYQNPSKVVSDAFINALNAKSLTYTGTVTAAGPTKMVATLNGGLAEDGGTVNAKFAFDVNDRKYAFDGSGIIDEKNDLYFKVQNIDGLANNYRRAMPAESQELFDQIIDKVDDKWIKISSEDLKNYSADLANMQKCTADAVSKLKSDDAVRSELVDMYKKHPFITINKTLGAKDGSLGYALSSNGDKEKSFNKEYRNSALYKSLVKCDDSFTIKDEDLAKSHFEAFDKNTSTELWVDQWTHQITKLALNNVDKDQTTNISIEPKFNRAVAIATPKESTTVEQLQKDVMELLQSAQSAPVQTPAPQP